MQRDLKAIALWHDWSTAIARSNGDVSAVLPAITIPRITSKKVPAESCARSGTSTVGSRSSCA